MRFHLILPGLLWPSQVLRDTAHDLPLPSLSWLLGRGNLRWQAPLPLEHWLCRESGCEQQPPPAAALRLLGEGGNPGQDIWICVDPVHLQFQQGRPSLRGGSLDITADEMQQLATTLAPLFAELGEFRCGVPGHAYLKLRALPKLQTPPPSAAIGRSHPLPGGPEAAQWRRLGNEAQMLLHALPLNAQRETAGLPTINSLWFWGAGILPARKPGLNQSYQCSFGRQSLQPGLAEWSGMAHSQDIGDSATLLAQPQATQLLLDDLLAPTQQLDANAWRQVLLEIERSWLRPLQGALRSGRLQHLRVTAMGEETSFELSLSRADTLKFWRRPKALHELAGLLAEPR